MKCYLVPSAHRLVLVFLAFALLLTSSCDKFPDPTPIDPVEPVELSTQKQNYAPYEIVTFKTPESVLGTKTIEATINEVKVQVTQGDTIASFLLPDLSSGSYLLHMTDDNNAYTVPIEVSSIKNLKSPDVYYSEIETQINQNILGIIRQADALLQKEGTAAEAEELKQNAQKYANLLQDYKTQYAALSNQEKQEFAKAMAANEAMIEEFNKFSQTLKESVENLRMAQSVDDYETKVTLSMHAYVQTVIFTVGHIPIILTAAKIAALAPDPYTKAGAILALGVSMTSFMVFVQTTAAASANLVNQALKPYEDLSVSEAVFEIGKEKAVQITANYRSLFQGDVNSSPGGSVISSILEKYQTFKTSYQNLVNNLPGFMRPSTTVNYLKSRFSTAKRAVYNRYISIRNISNPNVTLLQINQEDGSVKLKANTEATTDQSFTYDIVYSNGGFSSGLSETINAKVLAEVDSTEIYAASAIGKYTVSGPPALGNGPNTRLDCELHAGGWATYTIYDDPSWPDGYSWRIGWFVSKVDNKYYILTGWTNPGYLQEEAQPLTYPVTNFVYRHKYVK